MHDLVETYTEMKPTLRAKHGTPSPPDAAANFGVARVSGVLCTMLASLRCNFQPNRAMICPPNNYAKYSATRLSTTQETSPLNKCSVLPNPESKRTSLQHRCYRGTRVRRGTALHRAAQYAARRASQNWINKNPQATPKCICVNTAMRNRVNRAPR